MVTPSTISKNFADVVKQNLQKDSQGDGLVTQYQNNTNYYLFSTVPFLSGFRHVTWIYPEESNEKGARACIGTINVINDNFALIYTSRSQSIS